MGFWLYLLALCLVAVIAELWVTYRRHGQLQGRYDELVDELEEALSALARAEQQLGEQAGLAPVPGPLRAAGELTEYGWQRIGEILAVVPRLGPGADVNGRILADRLRSGSSASDVSIAGQVLVLLDFSVGLYDVCQADDRLDDADAFRLLGDALAMAAVELTSFARTASPECP
jgi:hypothetical protein